MAPMTSERRRPITHYPLQVRVWCSACPWTGYRSPMECECYAENAMYCRPWTPGRGCPAGIRLFARCPKCHAEVRVATWYRSEWRDPRFYGNWNQMKPRLWRMNRDPGGWIHDDYDCWKCIERQLAVGEVVGYGGERHGFR